MNSNSANQAGRPPLRALDLLPPELLLSILSHLPLDAISRFSRVSRTCHSLVTESESSLYRAIGYGQGLTDPQSAGSTQALVAPPAPERAQDVREELERIISAQQSMSNYYDGVEDWLMFVRKAHRLRLAWKRSQPAERWVKLQNGRWFSGGGFHRFKLDTAGRRIVTTGEEGGIQAFTTEGRLVWYSTSPAHAYPHVEMSGPYIAISHGEHDHQFVIYRRAELCDPPSRLTSDQYAALNSSIVVQPPFEQAYVPFALIDPETMCLASKLRLPYLALVAAGQTGVHVFDILDGSKRIVDISALSDPQGLADNRISYVELFGEHVLLAGSRSISAWHRTRGTISTVPPSPPVGTRRGHFRGTAGTPNYSAVHHDGNNLVAVSYGWRFPYDGHLMLSVEPSSGEDGALKVGPEKTFVLKLNAVCLQLAVENRKAVVITQHAAVFYALWLVDLTLVMGEDAVVRPTAPRCLCFPLPCHSLPSRVEMTSDQIFFPATSALSPGGSFRPEYSRLKALANEHSLPWEWTDLNDESLVRSEGCAPIEHEGSFAHRWMDLLDRIDGSDAKIDSLCVLSFGEDE